MKESKSERYIREYEEAGDKVEEALAEVRRLFLESWVGKRLVSWKKKHLMDLVAVAGILYCVIYIILFLKELR